MRIDFNLSKAEQGAFRNACEAAIRSVGSSSKAAVTDAALEIMAESQLEVPVDTGALASSAFVGVSRRSDLKSYRYGAVLGYGDKGSIGSTVGLDSIQWLKEPSNTVNPKTGLPASAYASTVHEDLNMPHRNGGKAKFLEDPVRNWAAGRFSRVALTYWKSALNQLQQQGTGVQRGGVTTHLGGSL